MLFYWLRQSYLANETKTKFDLNNFCVVKEEDVCHAWMISMIGENCGFEM